MQKGKKTLPGGLSISERGRLQAVQTHTSFSPIHLWPARKVIPFAPFLKESLIYDFGRKSHSKLLMWIPVSQSFNLLFKKNLRFCNNWSKHFPSGTSWRKYCYRSFPNSVRYRIIFHSVFQGKNEKVEFSQYHCKENTRKSTRQMKLSAVEKPPASSQETWVADLVWPQEITETQP